MILHCVHHVKIKKLHTRRGTRANSIFKMSHSPSRSSSNGSSTNADEITAFGVVYVLSHKIFMWCRRAMDRFASFLIYDIRFDELLIMRSALAIPIEYVIFYSVLHLFYFKIMMPMIMIDFSICYIAVILPSQMEFISHSQSLESRDFFFPTKGITLKFHDQCSLWFFFSFYLKSNK